MAYKLIKFADKILNVIIYVVLIIAFLFCLYALFDTVRLYIRASNYSVSYLKPTEEDPAKSFSRLKDINKDVCAWITIDGTSIDYPVVKGKTNAEYLNKDVYKNYSIAGTLFLDYRNSTDLKDLHSIIFGHHMDGGAMFGDIKKFIDKDFFEKNQTGTIYTSDAVYDLETFAFIDTDAYDKYIYSVNKDDKAKQQELIDYIKKVSINYREINLKEDDIIIALSTCSSATTNGRDVLLVRLNKKLGDD